MKSALHGAGHQSLDDVHDEHEHGDGGGRQGARRQNLAQGTWCWPRNIAIATDTVRNSGLTVNEGPAH